MKRFKALLIPSESDEGKFENIEDFDVALLKAQSHKGVNFYLKEFDTEKERDAYLLGYTQGIGYLGDGLYYFKDEF